MRNKTSVACSDCGFKWDKRTDTLSEWKGRCRSCTSKHTANDPQVKAAKSLSSKAQCLRQGGIPNARKFTSGNSGPNNATWKGGMPRCADCNAQLSRRDAQRCDECSKKMRPKGKDHPHWSGGLRGVGEYKSRTAWRNHLSNTQEYKEWRQSVFARDNYKCVQCGTTSSAQNPITADHIEPTLTNPGRMLDVSNGRTLCIDCHRKTDTWGFKGYFSFVRELKKKLRRFIETENVTVVSDGSNWQIIANN